MSTTHRTAKLADAPSGSTRAFMSSRPDSDAGDVPLGWWPDSIYVEIDDGAATREIVMSPATLGINESLGHRPWAEIFSGASEPTTPAVVAKFGRWFATKLAASFQHDYPIGSRLPLEEQVMMFLEARAIRPRGRLYVGSTNDFQSQIRHDFFANAPLESSGGLCGCTPDGMRLCVVLTDRSDQSDSEDPRGTGWSIELLPSIRIAATAVHELTHMAAYPYQVFVDMPMKESGGKGLAANFRAWSTFAHPESSTAQTGTLISEGIATYEEALFVWMMMPDLILDEVAELRTALERPAFTLPFPYLYRDTYQAHAAYVMEILYQTVPGLEDFVLRCLSGEVLDATLELELRINQVYPGLYNKLAVAGPPYVDELIDVQQLAGIGQVIPGKDDVAWRNR